MTKKVETETNEEATISIEKNNVSNIKEENKKQLDKLIAEREELRKELDIKKFLIDGGINSANMILTFIKNDAKWKFTEVLGIIEVHKAITTFLDSAKKGKEKDFMISPLELEAIYYFLSKVEGTGIVGAHKYCEILKLINPAKARLTESQDSWKLLEYRISSLENGLDDPNKNENTE